jgi:hypothetical protein
MYPMYYSLTYIFINYNNSVPIKILSISTKSVSDNYLLESEHNEYIRVVSP